MKELSQVIIDITVILSSFKPSYSSDCSRSYNNICLVSSDDVCDTWSVELTKHDLVIVNYKGIYSYALTSGEILVDGTVPPDLDDSTQVAETLLAELEDRVSNSIEISHQQLHAITLARNGFVRIKM